MVCQKTIYQLKFQKQADCSNARCKSTCHKVRELWGRPRSPLAGFNGNSIGKCDACFRGGFCSVSECSAQKAMEKTIISKVVNKAKLTGFVDSSIMKKMMKKIMKNKSVNFGKYAKKVKKTIKKGLKNKKFKANFRKISKSLQLLAAAQSQKDLKAALKNVNSSLNKAKASKTVKNNIRKIAQNFNALVEKKRATGKNKKSKKIVSSAKKKIKKVLKLEIVKINKYHQRVKNAKNKVKSVLEALKNKATLSDKTKNRIGKLQGILNNLRQVMKILKGTQTDINSTLASIQAAVKEFQ